MANKDIIWVERIEGKDKPRYHNIGVLIEKEDGKTSIKLNVLPGPGWNGWLSVFEKRDKDEGGF